MDFLDRCDPRPFAEIKATLDAVAEAPPPTFSGGLRWQAMSGDMAGIHEVRTKDGRDLYRLFCVLERRQPGLDNCSIIALAGMTKTVRSAFTAAEYGEVRRLRDEYFSCNPRSVAG